MKKNSKLLTKELAEKLAKNNVNISLWDVIESGTEDVYKTVFNAPVNRIRIERPERFIVAIGAGASHDAFHKLSLGAGAGESLQNHFQRKLGKKSGLITGELERLERVYRLNKNDFETRLLAISKFFPQELKKELLDRYNHKFYPSLTYEVIAHLMKHRFVDAVINFNYDELLDQAIEDELGDEEYKKVIVEGDYDESSIIDNTGLKHPIYLKPHGTSSNHSSLRFTREDYFALPPGIASLIKQLLSGVEVKIGNKKDKTPVNLIVIGFNMQSFEFNMLFEECFPAGSKIYFINTELPPKPFPSEKELKIKMSKRRKEFLQMIEEDNLIKVNEGRNTLDNVMWRLWNNIENCFQNEYKPRRITRHKLISDLFKEHNLIQERSSSGHLNALEYLKDRAWLELTLSVAKYKGFINYPQLVNDRFGKYFILYRQELDEMNKIDLAHVNDFKIYPRTILQFCEGIGLSSSGYSGRAYTLGTSKEKSNRHDSSLLTLNDTFFKDQIPGIFQKLINKVDESTRKRLRSLEESYKTTLIELFNKEDSEVSPKYDSSDKSIFLNPRLIKTSLSLDYYTRFYCRKMDWTALLVVAETGEWMLTKMEEFTDKRVILVAADNVKEKALEKKIHKNNLEFHHLHWWLHNQHMTIFLKGKEPNYEPFRAIYFVKRLRRTHIHPVILEDLIDCKLLVSTFAAYCQKAKNIKLSKDNDVSSEVTMDDIRDFFEKHCKNL